MTVNDLSGKTILILGFGKEGKSTLVYLEKHALAHTILLADEHKVETPPRYTAYVGEGYHALLNEKGIDVVIKTPGIPWTNPVIVSLQKRGIPITTQGALFLQEFRDQTIGITGTKGKSTTTSLLAHVLTEGGKRVKLLGNIGKPFFDEWDDITPNTLCIAEFSSYQLQNLTVSPHIAVIQQITKAHLDVHSNWEEYVEAKRQITAHQGKKDYVFIASSNTEPLAFIQSTRANVVIFNPLDPIYGHFKTQLVGEFNRVNVVPSILIGRMMGIPDETIQQALLSYTTLPHRLQNIGTYKGITFIEDSIGTVVEATIGGIDAFNDSLVALITGGYDNGQDYEELAEKILASNIQYVAYFAPTGSIVHKIIKEKGQKEALTLQEVHSMEEAVRYIYGHVKGIGGRPQTCLLGCASPSFGLFNDYLDRAEQFAYWVKKLGKE